MNRGGRGVTYVVVRWALALIVAAAVVVPTETMSQFSRAEPAAAVSASDFDPGNIISDSRFYDANAMTASEIQAFLDAKIGTCKNGKCLNVAMVPFSARAPRYSADYPDRLICAAVDGGNFRVSELIYRVQRACSISAKVILATIQKEQGIVTSQAPSDYALRFAMGYACPDSSGCSNANAGLGVQIYQGARQLMTYKVSSEVWKYKPSSASQFIAYHPDYYVNGRCGGTQVVIRNFATAALYNYTPYQPNAAALANLGSTGDDCSSYGNRNFWTFYSDWFGNPHDIVPEGVTVSRIAGADRYQVAARVSSTYFAAGASVVYIASGEVFPDAISAGPAAATRGGPVLLVQRNAIPTSIASELDRLDPDRIVVVGGPATISDAVLSQLASYAATVERIGGADRYAVSRDIAADSFESATVAYLATGAVFADALSSGAAAGSVNAPVVLIDGSLGQIDDATSRLLTDLGVTDVRIAGGPGSVSQGIYDSLVAKLGDGAVTRFGGANRFKVSAAVNTQSFPTAGTFFVASGMSFPDALSATPAAVASSAPLYVTEPSCLTREQVEHMIDAGATKLVIVGGSASVSDTAALFRNC